MSYQKYFNKLQDFLLFSHVIDSNKKLTELSTQCRIRLGSERLQKCHYISVISVAETHIAKGINK